VTSPYPQLFAPGDPGHLGTPPDILTLQLTLTHPIRPGVDVTNIR